MITNSFCVRPGIVVSWDIFSPAQESGNHQRVHQGWASIGFMGMAVDGKGHAPCTLPDTRWHLDDDFAVSVL